MSEPTKTAPQPSFERGKEIIRKTARALPETPGVYRMLDDNEQVLYVGKARALARRVMSYTQINRLPRRLQRMVSLTQKMEIVHTHTEAEALLLEASLIKSLRPPYNILLRDDKSFPWIYLSTDHDYPKAVKHRGAKKGEGQYFGPFASAGSVNRTLGAIQKAFMLRNCSDTVFEQRTRPCLQYHIKRCTAPCVDYVSKAEYAEQVAETEAFLTGRSADVQARFAIEMQAASEALDFEKAARYRDRIKAMTIIQSGQSISLPDIGDADLIGLASRQGRACIQVFFVRGGQNFGNQAFYPRHDSEADDADILQSFLSQFYRNKGLPPLILTSHEPAEKEFLENAFSEIAERKVQIVTPKRGPKLDVMQFVCRNASEAMARNLTQTAHHRAMLEALAERFDLSAPPERIEIYDNSHTGGTNMVGAMVVSGPEGFNKKAYRKFNIKEAKAGDDFGMMREVMQRRFRGAADSEGDEDHDWPDLLLIDGGAGQLSSVLAILEEQGVDREALSVISIAKGVDRNAGREWFHRPGKAPVQLPTNDPLLHYLQNLRDEAHRFAIGAHRQRRAKAAHSSSLDTVPGIGAKRKKALLQHFGSAKSVARAGVADLMKVPGISESVAQTIYDHFHEGI